MMGIGFPELMIILVIIMIIFGAGKLPQIGSAFGQSIKNFKSSMKEAEEAGESSEEVAEGESQPAGELQQENLSDEEKERLAREKAQADGEAKDKAMREQAEAFTATLPRKGSYDFTKDQEDQAEKKA